jgi:hypothetical protein
LQFVLGVLAVSGVAFYGAVYLVYRAICGVWASVVSVSFVAIGAFFKVYSILVVFGKVTFYAFIVLDRAFVFRRVVAESLVLVVLRFFCVGLISNDPYFASCYI